MVYDSKLFIGSPDDSLNGSVSVYHLNSTTNSWELNQTINGSSTNSKFGTSFSISGSSLFVGAPNLSMNGSVILYNLNSTTNSWEYSSNITSPGNSQEESFGFKLFNVGNYLFIAAPNSNQGNGTVYLYEKNASNIWNNISQIIPTDITSGAKFGSSIFSNDNFVFIGSPNNSLNGSVSVYKMNINNTFTKLQETVAEVPDSLDCYYGGNVNCTMKQNIKYFLNYSNSPMNYGKSNSWNFNNVWNGVFNNIKLPISSLELGCNSDTDCLTSSHCIKEVCVSTIPEINDYVTNTPVSGSKVNLSLENIVLIFDIKSPKLANISFSMDKVNEYCNLYGFCSSFFNPQPKDDSTINRSLVVELSFVNSSDLSSGIENNTKYLTSGKYDGGREFNGVNSSINLSNRNVDYNGNFSVFAWVKFMGYEMPIIGEYDSVESGEWGLGVNASGNFVYYQKDGSNANNLFSNKTLEPDKWNFIGVTRNDSFVKFYLNGVEINSTTGANSQATECSSSGSELFVGKLNNVFANGSIDEIYIFNETLSSQEMYLLYNKFIQEDGSIRINFNSLNYTNKIGDGAQIFRIKACNDRNSCYETSKTYYIETYKQYSNPTCDNDGTCDSGNGETNSNCPKDCSSTSPGNEEIPPTNNSVYNINTTEFAAGKNLSMKSGDIFKVSIINKEGTFKIKSVNSSYVVIQYFNDSKKNYDSFSPLSKGQELKVDVNSNNYYDLYIKVVNLNSTYATIFVKFDNTIVTSVPGPETQENPSNNGTSSDDPGTPAPIKGTPDENTGGETFIIVGVILGVIFIIIVIIMIISLNNKKIEKERNKKYQQTNRISNMRIPQPMPGMQQPRIQPMQKPINKMSMNLQPVKPVQQPNMGSKNQAINENILNKTQPILSNNSNVLNIVPKLNISANKKLIVPPISLKEVQKDLPQDQKKENATEDLKIIKDINTLLLSANAKFNQGDLTGAKAIYLEVCGKYYSLSKHNEEIYQRIMDFVNKMKSRN